MRNGMRICPKRIKNDKIRITTIFMYMKEKLIELTGALIEEEQ